MEQKPKKDRTVLLALGLVGCLGCMAPGALFAAVGAGYFLLSEGSDEQAVSTSAHDEDTERTIAALDSKKDDSEYRSDSYESAYVATPVVVETPAPVEVIETPEPTPVKTAAHVRVVSTPVRTPVAARTATPAPVRTPVARATSTPAPVARTASTPVPRPTATPLPWEDESGNEVAVAATPAPTTAPVKVAAVDPNKRVIRTQTGASNVTVGKNLAIKATDGKTAVGTLIDVKEGNVDVRIQGKLMRIHESQIVEAAEF